MPNAECSQRPERRPFGVHPAILLTLIREQAGSVDKAMAELVMNSVDAGARRIDITISETRFTISDDGRGFAERSQIETFFEKFGTPHNTEDAIYGRFRIGRGQIMCYAKTIWRSGPFEMRVNIADAQTDLGYELLTHLESASGCRIEGTFYDDAYINVDTFIPQPLNYFVKGAFKELVRYVPVPIHVNGVLLNTPPETVPWDMEDEFAWYRFRKDAHHTAVFNRGVLVEERPVRELGVGGEIVSKQPLTVNLARNAIIVHRCPVWKGIAKAIRAHFEIRLTNSRKLTRMETAALLNELAQSDTRVTGERREKLRKLRFIPDIFGELQSPEAFLAPGCFTLFDGKHQMIAERVQRQGRASVFVSSFFDFTQWKRCEENFRLTLEQLWTKLGFHGTPQWVPFQQYVEELGDTVRILEDSELTPEELLTLECLRFVNDELARSVCETQHRRRLVAGESESLDAWTDGRTYVAVERRQLRAMRGGRAWVREERRWSPSWNYGPCALMALLVHEYAHTDSSMGHHAHDLAFYKRFHEAVFRVGFGGLADVLQRRYITGLAKLQVTVSTPVRTLIDHAVAYSPKLKPKAIQKRFKE